MDMRKNVLLKKPLRDSISSLNNSIYESAAEDSDNSMYYSFTNNSIKDLDDTIENVPHENDPETSIVSEADKENTVIMNDLNCSEQSIKKIEEDVTPSLHKEEEKMEIDSVIVINDDENEQSGGQEDQKLSNDKQIPEVSNVVNNPKPLIIPQIIIGDPNENIVNPFTLSVTNQQDNHTHLMESPESRDSIESDKVTKRIVQEKNKKSASKIPTRTHLYSPIQRTSLDKKSKIITKPLTRRTIYETRSMVTRRPSIIPPVQTKTTVPKPTMHKCTKAGCLREFHTVKSLQDHLKLHNKNPSTSTAVSTSSHSSFKCKWCDKVFELNTALTTHMLEKCLKISFTEKRKLLAQQEKVSSINDNKRKSVFVAPTVPKKRSPKRQTLNRSGVMITPKKTLKCDCGKKFTDVLEFANHTIAHKYEGALKPKQK